MKRLWSIRVWLALLAAAASAAGQEAAPVPDSPRLLTLSSPVLRASMDRVNLAWLIPEQLPDFRLKVDRPEATELLTPAELDVRLRGVEVRLPVSGLWLGYEQLLEDEEPRATISLQRGF